ncbi:hypothetical protein BV898_06003 [Hypsibius exemplaris]|uniref:Uncharacterized protein n=1 Tax=Hypsibius exemplaris TaxID=2072580 RepID=A0A1W0WXT0_HYPEX|nr:hypothetical protein BV898_06003 [Hypsibius exemplaris]
MWYRSNVPEFSYPYIWLTCGAREDTVYTGSFSPECGPADPPTRIPTTSTPAPARPQSTTSTIHPTQLTKSYPPIGWTPAQPTRQTDYQTTPGPGSQDNCQKIEPLIVTCRKGKMTFSLMKPNETDALVAILNVDNTLQCRLLMHGSHTWLIPGRQQDERQSLSPINVKCTKEGVTVSDDQPDDSEATLLTLTTTGNIKCRLMFVDYVNYLQALAGVN